jgi:hypothetical protein
VEESPLGHFLATGRKAGSLPNPMIAPKLKVLDQSMPADVKTRQWLIQRRPVLLSIDALLESFADLLFDSARATIVSISQDDYLENIGGIQLCLAEEQLQANHDNCNYIHIAPLQSLLVMDEESNLERIVYRVSANGESLGTASAHSLLEVLVRLKTGAPNRWVLALHHLLGHSEKAITELVSRMAFDAVYAWLHDRFFACEQYNLLRNEYEYCHAPHAHGAHLCCPKPRYPSAI